MLVLGTRRLRSALLATARRSTTVSERPRLFLVRTDGMPIFEQLQMEEALYREEHEYNWLLVNRHVGDAAVVVLGLSGVASELVHVEAVLADRVPVIRRFSGGGTVLVTPGIVTTSLIVRSEDAQVDSGPRSIMAYVASLFGDSLNEALHGVRFSLVENDFVIESRMKVAGNAQALSRRRWLQHTSWLYEFEAAAMERYLQLPARRPAYRDARPHSSFLARLAPHVDSRDSLIDALVRGASTRFDVVETDREWIREFMLRTSLAKPRTVRVALASSERKPPP